VLRERVITALVLVVVVSTILFLSGPLAFSGFIAAVSLVAAWEWSNLSGFQQRLSQALYIAAVALGLVASAVYIGILDSSGFNEQPDRERVQSFVGGACLWWCLALLWVQSYPASGNLWGARWIRAIMGLVVILPTWVAMSYLKWLPGGSGWIVLIVALVAAADVGAYFSGRRWGKKKLAPNVSPGKSWAGFFGGSAAVALLAIVVSFFFDWSFMQQLAFLVVALITSVASVLGDLLESMVKRHRGIKDSSQLLPGHGGVLDRIDSLTAAAPVFTLALILAGWQ